MTQVQAIVEFKLEEKTLEGFAFVGGNSLVIELINKKFFFYDGKGIPKDIPIKELQKVYLNEDELYIVLSYKDYEVRFNLTQHEDDYKTAWHCIANKVI